ncbi:MAG: hypothetical protein JXR97_13485 [Planctomycetes bacterium]|nr:hypothetical protein [Planctomycetota bacterium]
MTKQDDACYNHIRFVMDDADGYLHFRRISMDNSNFCASVIKQLEDYLKTRPLKDIEIGKVREIISRCRTGCGEDLVSIIEEQKEFFCNKPRPSDVA